MIREQLLKLANNRVASGLLSGLERTERDAAVLRVLTYHRVAEHHEWPHLSVSTLSATPADFAAQMRYVATSYTPVSARMVLDYFDRGVRLPPRAILITFDDAYQDFADHAWGVLKAVGIPAVLFVPTGYPDQPDRALWWDRLYDALQRTSCRSVVMQGIAALPLGTARANEQTFKRLRTHVKRLPHAEAIRFVNTLCHQLGVASVGNNGILSWESIRQLESEGLTVAAHTRTHPLLTQVSEDEAVQEVIESVEDLRRQVACVLPIFAYPGGATKSSLVVRLRQAGLKVAFTTERGINRLHTADALMLKRINVGRNTTMNVLRAQLLSVSASVYDLGAGRKSAFNEV